MSKKVITRVRDVMKTDFASIDGSATISEALQVMKTQKTSVLVVNKRHDNDEYALVTSGDIARMYSQKIKLLSALMSTRLC